MRDVGRVVLHGCAVVGQQVIGLLGVEDCAVGPDQGAGEHEGCGEGGLCVHAVVGQQVFGLLGVGDSAVGLDQGGVEYE